MKFLETWAVCKIYLGLNFFSGFIFLISPGVFFQFSLLLIKIGYCGWPVAVEEWNLHKTKWIQQKHCTFISVIIYKYGVDFNKAFFHAVVELFLKVCYWSFQHVNLLFCGSLLTAWSQFFQYSVSRKYTFQESQYMCYHCSMKKHKC